MCSKENVCMRAERSVGIQEGHSAPLLLQKRKYARQRMVAACVWGGGGGGERGFFGKV